MHKKGSIVKQDLIIVDSPALCHRAKYAMKNVDLSHDEMKTEIIFNFLNDVLGLAKRFDSNAFAFAWDSKKSYRTKLYPQYKWKRKEKKTKEEEYINGISYKQFSILRRNVLPNLGFKNNPIQTGLEADDIIASLVRTNYKRKSVIISRDNDLWQLIQNNCSQYDFQTKKMMTEERFTNEHKIKPPLWGTVKQIAGCSTDNVLGIDGVGNKTAIKFLRSKLPKNYKTYEKINSKEGREVINRNFKLVVLPFEGTKKYTYKENILHSKDFFDTFEKLNFRSFLRQDSFREWEDAFNLQ